MELFPIHDRIGYTCAYTPLPLIHAAGFIPYRVSSKIGSPNLANQLLHENLCPHAKGVLDRAISNDLPNLSGMVFVNSCDTMRRLADAWKIARPQDPIIVIELPPVVGELETMFLAAEFKRMWEKLCGWSGSKEKPEIVFKSINLYNELGENLEQLRQLVVADTLEGGRALLQKVYNKACELNPKQALSFSQKVLESEPLNKPSHNASVFLFGNILPDVEVFDFFESCGIRICDDDLCTGSRIIRKIIPFNKDPFLSLAHSIHEQSPCARTFDLTNPGSLAHSIQLKAKACRAKGVIGHILKFCDPYLLRMPFVRVALHEIFLPFLLLEGDCTLRTIGQQQTRVEAFAEIIEGG